MRDLVQQAVFGEDRVASQEEIKKLAQSKGVFLSSTYKLYEAMAKGKAGGFTVPAFNFRTLTFDASRALFRAAKKQQAGAFIIELAKSEMQYTDQTPEEFAACCLAGACEEGWCGPLFLQGDHFKCQQGTPEEIDELKSLIVQAIEAGFYNIDIDSSALPVRDNAELTFHFTRFIRSQRLGALTISVGGEVGQIGKENTTVEQLREFMAIYQGELEELGGLKGLSKLAVQTGTAHGKGGVVDFELLKELSQEARKHGVAGVVQHGASTLEDSVFEKFPGSGACEIHLSTALQNIIIEALPLGLAKKIKSKKDLGPLKQEIWNVGQGALDRICQKLEERFGFFFEKLNVAGTAGLVKGLEKR